MVSSCSLCRHAAVQAIVHHTGAPGDHAFEYQWHSMQHRRGNDIGSAGSTHINYNFHHADGMTSIMPLMLKREAGGSQAAEVPVGGRCGSQH